MQQNIQNYLLYFFTTLVLSAIYGIVYAAFQFGQYRAIFFISLLIVLMLIVGSDLIMSNPKAQGEWSSYHELVILTGLVGVTCFAVVLVAGLRSFVQVRNHANSNFSEWKAFLNYGYKLSPVLLLIWNLINIVLLIIFSLPLKM